MTAERVHAEIKNAEAGLDEIRQRGPTFAALVADRQTLFELIDDYGMGAVKLACKDATGFHFTKVYGRMELRPSDSDDFGCVASVSRPTERDGEGSLSYRVVAGRAIVRGLRMYSQFV